MAEPRTYRNAGGAPTNDNDTLKPILVISCASTCTFVSALGPPERYMNKDLQRATKLALKLFVKGQKHG